MSEAIMRIPPCLSPFNQTKNILPNFSQHLTIKTHPCLKKTVSVSNWSIHVFKSPSSSEELDPPPPLFLNLKRVSSEAEFDLILHDAHNNQQPVIVLWMASWCRKCIYLKPKLEKLAAQYYQRVKFYCVDVNGVSHKFVVRAEVTKMPTIQLWKDSMKQAEVIGGHKAFLVVNEVRNMIENEFVI